MSTKKGKNKAKNRARLMRTQKRREKRRLWKKKKPARWQAIEEGRWFRVRGEDE